LALKKTQVKKINFHWFNLKMGYFCFKTQKDDEEEAKEATY